jgi:divalent metal cation (Fe/Co/Zn/Cd) transporter
VEIDADKSTAEAHDISEEVEYKLHGALGVEPTVHIDPVHPNDPLVQEVNKVLSLLCESDERIADIHDVRIVNTENHHVILFGINIQVGLSQKEIVSCTLNLENRLKEKFKNYEINIKVSPLHRF